jgi:sulfonate transport system substrate-binding protein
MKPYLSKLNYLTLAGAIFIVMAMIVAGCSDNAGVNSGNKEGSDKEKTGNSAEKQALIKVNVAINGGINPLSIVKDKGWLDEAFQELGAEVAWSEFPSGPPLLEALAADRVDLSFLGDGATISGAAAGLPFEIIALISEGQKANAILVPTDSAIQSVEDLKGKKVGLAKGTTAHVYLTKVLINHGLNIEDVDIINLQPDDGAAAFAGGQLDAWVIWDPNITVQTSSKQGRTIAWDNENVLAPGSMIGRTGFLKEHPELTVAYLQVYKKAADWMQANKEEAATFFAAQKKIPEAVVSSILVNSSATLQAYDEKALEAQQLSADLLLKSGFLKKELDFKTAVNNEYVNEAIKNEAIK